MLRKFMKRWFGATRQKVTRTQLASILAAQAAKLAFIGDDSLNSRIRSIDPELQDTITLRIEMLTFSLLPFDIISSTEFSSAQPRIRSEMAHSVCEIIRSMMESPDSVELDWDEVQRRVHDRLLSYAEVIGPSWRNDSMRRLTRTAYCNITGFDEVDPAVAQLLSVHFTLAMKHMPDVMKAYELVD